MSNKTVPMNEKQKTLIETALKAVKQSREQRDLDVLLEGIASGLDGKLIDCNTDTGTFSVEVPDIEKEA